MPDPKPDSRHPTPDSRLGGVARMVRSGRFVRSTGSKSMRRQFAREGFLRRLARRPRLYVAVALPLAIPFILASVTNDVAVSQASPAHVSRAAMIVTPLHYAELTAPRCRVAARTLRRPHPRRRRHTRLRPHRWRPGPRRRRHAQQRVRQDRRPPPPPARTSPPLPLRRRRRRRQRRDESERLG